MRKQTRVGLVIAALLGLADIAIVFALLGDGDHPPVAIVVISVIVGVMTLVAIPIAWRAPTRISMIVIVVTRVISALGDLAGLGEDAAVVIVSLVFFVLSGVCLFLLRSYFRAFRGGERKAPARTGD
jgi:hypothetical protein